MNRLLKNLAAACIIVHCASVLAAPIKPGWPDFSPFEEDLRAEGFTPLSAKQWEPYAAYFDGWLEGKTLQRSFFVKGVGFDTIDFARRNLDGTPASVDQYISTVYCLTNPTLSIQPDTPLIERLNQQLSYERWMTRYYGILWISMREFDYNKNVPSSIIKKQDLARIRLAARMLKRLTDNFDPNFRLPDEGMCFISNGELSIGYGFNGVHRVALKGFEGPAKIRDPKEIKLRNLFMETGVATEEMLSPEQIEREKTRISLAIKEHQNMAWNNHRVAVNLAEDSFVRALQRLTGQPEEIQSALVLAGYDSREKQQELFKRREQTGSWNLSIKDKFIGDLDKLQQAR